MFVFTIMLLQHALNTPNQIIFSAKLKTPPTCLSIEKELRQEPDVRSAGTSSTQTRAPKEFCNTKHGCWMNLHILRIRQLLKHRLCWNYVPLRAIQVTKISLRTQKQFIGLPVCEKTADRSLTKVSAPFLNWQHYGNNAMVLHRIKSVWHNCSKCTAVTLTKCCHCITSKIRSCYQKQMK